MTLHFLSSHVIDEPAVYFLHWGGWVKVGKTKHLRKRLYQHRKALDPPPELLGFVRYEDVRIAAVDEHRIHVAWDPIKVPGRIDWFYSDRTLLEWIARTVDQPNRTGAFGPARVFPQPDLRPQLTGETIVRLARGELSADCANAAVELLMVDIDGALDRQMLAMYKHRIRETVHKVNDGTDSS
jgi:hypothetical protein